MGVRFFTRFAIVFCLGLVAADGAKSAETVRVDARDYPFSAIGRLNLGGSGFCSAMLVGPDLVLSAASCLFNHTEGRWWGRNELFFQGGYQFENAENQAGIADYAAPKSYRPDGRLTLNSARANFALLKLKRPIGKKAGWFGIKWNDETLARKLRSHRSSIHLAGYSHARQHVQVIDFGCNAIAGTCPLTPQRLALRPFVEQGGGYYALPLRGKTNARGRARLRQITSNLLRRLGYRTNRTPAPSTGKTKPVRTVSLMMRQLTSASYRPPVASTGPARSNGRIAQRSLGDMVRASGRALR